jgi:hypothetical protein
MRGCFMTAVENRQRQRSRLRVSKKERPPWLAWTVARKDRPELIVPVTFPVVVDGVGASLPVHAQVTVTPLSRFTYQLGLSKVCEHAYFISNVVFEMGSTPALGELAVYPYSDATHSVACRLYSGNGHYEIVTCGAGWDVVEHR